MQIPPCYGNLHDLTNELCQACLLQQECKQAMLRPKLSIGEKTELLPMPRDKKSQILLICKKFGIMTAYTPRGSNTEVVITEENKGDFFNLDFLLTSDAARKRLYEVELK